MRFFFNDTATTEIYTLSLHDALPISRPEGARRGAPGEGGARRLLRRPAHPAALRVRVLAAAGRAEDRQALRGILRLHQDRKSTRLNSSHANISYAVFCLKKKNVSQDH